MQIKCVIHIPQPLVWSKSIKIWIWKEADMIGLYDDQNDQMHQAY